MPTGRIDHMVITIAIPEQSGRLRQVLSEHQFPVTLLDAAMNETPNAAVTVIAGMAQYRLPLFFQLLRAHVGIARPRVGGSSSDTHLHAAAVRGRLPACVEMDHVVEVRIGLATSYVVPVSAYLQMMNL